MKQLNINEMNIVSGAGTGTNNISRNNDIKTDTKSNQSSYGYNSAISNIYDAVSRSILEALNRFFW